jgi:spermidine synthase
MLLYFIILLEGFVTVSLEILTIRQLLPIVGNSVIVTSLIIGVFLLFLAYGYRHGGKCTENYPQILQRNFFLAALGLGIGLSYTFVALFFQVAKEIFPHATLAPLCLYLLLIIAPIVFCLGQTVPISLNLWRKKSSVGDIGGQVLHLSTLGSFLGATLTALVLLNYLGVAWSIFINFAILSLLVLLLMDIKTQTALFISTFTLASLVYGVNITFDTKQFIATNNYGNFQIITRPTNKEAYTKFLVINNLYHSCLNEKNQACPYVETIKKILFTDLKLTGKNILVLGAGGFTLSAENTYGNKFLYVDIDKSLPNIIKQSFQPTIQGNFISDDARHFINTTSEHFDVIISDTYNGIAVPAHLVTQEYFTQIRSALTTNGMAIFNIVATPSLGDAYSKHIDNTIRSVFKNCMATPTTYHNDDISNIIYVCTKSQTENNAEIYTDNLNRADSEYYKLSA